MYTYFLPHDIMCYVYIFGGGSQIFRNSGIPGLYFAITQPTEAITLYNIHLNTISVAEFAKNFSPKISILRYTLDIASEKNTTSIKKSTNFHAKTSIATQGFTSVHYFAAIGIML